MTLSVDDIQSSTSIAPFTGGISKDHDPASDTYGTGVTVLQTYDIGTDGAFVPVRTRMPIGQTNFFPEIKYEYHDATTTIIQNSSPLSVRDDAFQDLMDALLGGAAAAASNDGKAIRKIILQVNNQTGGDVTIDLAAFRVRAFTVALGSGSAP